MTSVQMGFFALCEMGNRCLFLNYNYGECKHFQGASNILISHVLSTLFQQLSTHEVMASPVSSLHLSLWFHPRTCPGTTCGREKAWLQGLMLIRGRPVTSFHPFKLYSNGLLNRNAGISNSEGSHFQPEFYTQAILHPGRYSQALQNVIPGSGPEEKVNVRVRKKESTKT